jgi:hypothetical protein
MVERKKAELTLGTLVLQRGAKMFLNSLFSLQNFVIFRPLQNDQWWSERQFCDVFCWQ